MMIDTDKNDPFAESATASLTLKSWDRFKTPNLRVEPNLLGAFHSFAHHGKSVKISLPTAAEADNADRVKLDHWRGRDSDGQLEPADYLIHSVDVSVSLPGTQTFPSAVLEQPPNAFDMISPDEQQKLNRLSDYTGQIALEAFDLWMRCVRWKTGLGRFGRAAVVGPETGWKTRLCDTSSGKTVWIGKVTFIVSARPSVTSKQWETIASALVAGESPPVFVDLLFDAEMHIEAGDFRRAVIDVAVAAEVYIRSTVRSVLPGEMGEESGQFMPITKVLRTLFPKALTLLGKTACRVCSELREIFIDRNKTMHGGVADLSKEKCDRYTALVRTLVADRLK